METWTVRNTDGTVLGVFLAEWHYASSLEIHLMVVEREHHGAGIGSALCAAVEPEALAEGMRLLQVKTFGPSRADVNCSKSRRF